jgi:4-amino-4-deoxy-L-arabinose transferase-like glycosyltransferase
MNAQAVLAAPKRAPLSRQQALWLMVPVLLVAAGLRLLALGHVPPGLYHDEAYNGLDALRVLDGDLALYFGANNGREPIFIYLVALWVGLLGRSPFAVRFAAVFPGLLTVAVSFSMARMLFSRRVGLLTAAILSVTLWHFHLSRVGFRAVLLPLLAALVVWQVLLGWRTGRRRYWLAAGLLYGLSFYTYMAARFTPVALALFALYLWVTRPDWFSRHHLAPLAWSGLGVLLTLAPLAAFTLAYPDLVLGRTGQVSIWNPEINAGDFWGALARHIARTLGMFFVRGDRIWRHNLPWRPVFDPVLGGFFLIGLGVALQAFRRKAATAFILIWTATMTLPTLLAEDAPHFLRGVGLLPFVAAFPAMGLDWFARSLHELFRGRAGVPRMVRLAIGLLLAAIVTFGLVSAALAYFGDYANAETAGYWFESGAETLAGEVNGFLGTGWDGERMRHAPFKGRQVYVEPMLWHTWASVPFLVQESPAVALLPAGHEWPLIDAGPAAVFLWPYGDWRRVWGMWDGPVEVQTVEGAKSQGDRDPEPFTTYLAFFIAPAGAPPPALARFQSGVELVGVRAQPVAQGMEIELLWHATTSLADDYTIFVHYLREGQRLGQDDAQPAAGHYPTSRWGIGDLIHDWHTIPLPGAHDLARDQILVGLYRTPDGAPLSLLDQAGNPSGTYLVIPLAEVPR